MEKQNYLSSSRLISLLERRLSNSLKESFKCHGIKLTVEEFRTLYYLWYENGLTQNEIANKACKEKSLITKTINSLEKKGLIVRRRTPKDKRNKQVFLTDKSILLEDKAMSCANEITNLAESNISENEILVFLKVLKLMEDNLS